MALIKTIAELKQYVSVDANTKIDSIMPFIKEAEQLHIVPLLGQAFYDYYLPLYEAHPGTALSADNLKLLPYIQRALAYYTLVYAIPNMSGTFGDMGIRQHFDDKSQAAPRWLIEKLQYNALKNGDIHSDKLLEFLEANASPSKYSQWYADLNANTKMSGVIVYSTAIASNHILINNSRRVFLQLKNKIREVETRTVPKLISKEQYDELVTQIQTGSVTSENAALIAKIEPVVAKRALYMQLPFLRVQLNENGIFIYTGFDDLVKLGQLASDADIKVLRQQLCDPDEFGYPADETELNQFILDNIDDYPLIKESNVYKVQPDPGPTWTTQNDPCSKHFGV